MPENTADAVRDEGDSVIRAVRLIVAIAKPPSKSKTGEDDHGHGGSAGSVPILTVTLFRFQALPPTADDERAFVFFKGII